MKGLCFILLYAVISWSVTVGDIPARKIGLNTSSYPIQNSQYLTPAAPMYIVRINGEKFKTGVYFVASALRVYDVLKMASDDLKTEDLPRAILVDSIEIDILQYLCKNDLSQNPPVTSGMQIYVPYPNFYVHLRGAYQNNFHKVSLKKAETLGSMISLLTMESTADTSHVEIIRGDSIYTVERVKFSEYELQDNDVINILTKKARHLPEMVEVIGEVEKTGTYVIERGLTTVSDILKIARPLKSADTTRVKIYRKNISTSVQSPRPEVLAGLGNALGNILAFYNTGETLIDRDVIEIPKIETTVYVTGYVKTPRMVDFKKGSTWDYYVKQAGGCTKAADKGNIRVISTCGQTYHVRDVKEVQPGDIIMVPEGIETKWVKIWAPVISVLGSTASVIAALITITK